MEQLLFRCYNPLMILGYIDESGNTHEKGNNDLFVDGPYAIWSCVLVNEKKYFDVERTFQDLAKKYLGKNIKKKELHATDIWESRKTSTTQDKKVRQYFEELLQLTGKLHIPIAFGLQQKNPKLTKKTKKDTLARELELEKARYSLLTLIEAQLAKMNETGVLVSDKEGTLKNELQNLVFQRTKWRYSPPQKKANGRVKPRFLFEYQSNFIIDQLHYVDSQDSLLMQFADHICFVLRKVLEHLYLLHFSGVGTRPQANSDLVPVTERTFNAFASFCNIWYAHYDDKDKDVAMGELSTPELAYYAFQPLSGIMSLGGSARRG